jgi:hypothetical protein
MNELKIVQRKFGCIATSLDDGSDLSKELKCAIIKAWKPAAEKIRVFGTQIEEESGVTNAKTKSGHPTLKAMFEDHIKAIRSNGPLVIAPPSVDLSPVCADMMEWASKKNMGIAWVFYTGDKKVWGFTAAVAKVLCDEIPETVLFKGAEWSQWLDKWVSKYIQPHRRFDADQFKLVLEPVVIEDSCACRPKKKCKTKQK